MARREIIVTERDECPFYYREKYYDCYLELCGFAKDYACDLHHESEYELRIPIGCPLLDKGVFVKLKSRKRPKPDKY